jgi:hypothetical protein
MKVSQKAILKLLEDSGVGFTNAKKYEEIKEKIKAFGYTEAKLDELLSLNKTVESNYQLHEQYHGKKQEASDKLTAMVIEEQNKYSVYRQVARRMFEGDEFKGIRSRLGLDVELRKTFEGVIAQFIQFYQGMAEMPKNREKLRGTLGTELTDEQIQERLLAVQELKRLNEEQEGAKGTAKVARKDRDMSYRDLRKALENFKAVCRNEFRDTPEHLKTLKINPKKKRAGMKNKPTDGQDGETNPPAPVKEVVPTGQDSDEIVE